MRERVAFDLKDAARVIEEKGCTLGAPLEIMDETSSTNDVAKRAAKLGAPHGALWIAESQLAGRGRQGRSWIGVPGESLMFSVLVRLTCPSSRLPLLALASGLAVRDAIARAAPGAQVSVKWPNDVLVGGRKIAGIMVESIDASSKTPALVVGIGVNVFTRVFDGALADRATSVALVATDPPSRVAILADILEGLDRDLSFVAARGLGMVHARITAADALRDRPVQCDDGTEGVARGIDLEGRLRVERSDGRVVTLVAGEVHLLGPGTRASQVLS